MSKHSNHGGTRRGAGRPKGQGKYGEETQVLRIPKSRVAAVQQYLKESYINPDSAALLQFPADQPEAASYPLFGNKIAAGFASPADDYIETPLDLNDYLVKHPAATFFLRVKGDSMTGAGIHDEDLLVVDRSLSAKHGKVVIAALRGDLTVKRLHIDHRGGVSLMPENPAYPPLKVHDTDDLVIWGVVTHVIHAVST